jgi:hypothetical protein
MFAFLTELLLVARSRLKSQWVLLAHPSDEVADLAVDFRATSGSARFPALAVKFSVRRFVLGSYVLGLLVITVLTRMVPTCARRSTPRSTPRAVFRFASSSARAIG